MKSFTLLTCLLASCIILSLVNGQPAKCPHGCSRSACTHGHQKLFYYTPQKFNNMKQMQPVSRTSSIQYKSMPVFQSIEPAKHTIRFAQTQSAPAPAPVSSPCDQEVSYNYPVLNEYVSQKSQSITSSEPRKITLQVPIEIIRTDSVQAPEPATIPQSRSQEIDMTPPCKQDMLTGRTLEIHRELVPESNVKHVKFETFDTGVEEIVEKPIHQEVHHVERVPATITQHQYQLPTYVVQQEPVHYVAEAPATQIQEQQPSYQNIPQLFPLKYNFRYQPPAMDCSCTKLR